MENLNFRKDLTNYIKAFVPRDKDMKSPTAALMKKVMRKYILTAEAVGSKNLSFVRITLNDKPKVHYYDSDYTKMRARLEEFINRRQAIQ